MEVGELHRSILPSARAESPGDPDTVSGHMYRFLLRPKWIGFHLLVVVAIVTMINLGSWQLRRLDDRQAFNAQIEQRYDQPPVPLDELLTAGADPDDLEWRPVTTGGTYLPDDTILIANRSQGRRAGQNVVVPLRLDDDRILLVNRGFVPLAETTARPVPATEVAIVARLRATQEKRLGQLSDPAEGDLEIAQRVDIERLAAQLPGEVVPMYVDLVESDPPEVGSLPEPVAAPVLGEGNHLSYAVQWFIFATAVAVGWVLAVRRSIATHRRRQELAEPDS
jgi:cytochrome oxidase assembly protein ShyY1